jgi:uncharacterized coiled-coil protein SlyX
MLEGLAARRSVETV